MALPSNLSFDQAIEQVSKTVLEHIDLGNATPIVLIDGRAGSGKSTFAKALQEKLFQDGESAPPGYTHGRSLSRLGWFIGRG